jgi:hypothetical protein
LGERGGVDVLWLTGKVPQEVHLVDAAVDEYSAAVQVSTAAPLPWLEKGLLLQLHQSEVADQASLNECFTLPYRRHKTIVLGDHQGDPSPLGLCDDGPAFGKGTGDGFLHQDVFASLGRYGDVCLMHVVGGTQVHGFHPAGGCGCFIGAKRPATLEHRSVRLGTLDVSASEKEIDFVPQRQYALDKGPGILSAPDDT